MSRPRWQRARIVTEDTYMPVGSLIWVQCVPPETCFVHDIPSQKHYTYRGFTTNIFSPDEKMSAAVAREDVELLARGPEDFCDDPPRILWGAWNEGGR